MTALTDQLQRLVGQAFETCGLPAELGRVQVSDRPDLAQFQCNGAMAAAKQAKKNPRAVAEEVVARLRERPEFSKIEIAGPGFINLHVTDSYLTAYLSAMMNDARRAADPSGEGKTAVLDYGGPNIAKPMHVGHLRTAIIGDALRRMMLFAGYKVLADVHMGDWGTHMGMIVSEYLKNGESDKVTAALENDDTVAKLMEELSALYPRVSAACKEDEARKAMALDATVQIQNKEPAHYKLWQVIREASVRGMKKNYENLDVHFDLWKGEADVHDLIPAMVEALKKKGLAVEDQGALIVPVAREDDDKEIPPLILYKRDGAVMYGTTDLATIVERMDLYHPDKIVYVVDQRQHLHFEQVFRAARLAGFAPEDKVELTHAGFGTMNGPDGKPFKTRAGGVVSLGDVIAMAMEKARARLAEADLAQDMGAAEKEEVAHKVALAAIKFADLQNQRHADYIFDLDRLTSFEGKTGPYLLYQAVRIKSLLRKAEDQGMKIPGIDTLVVQDTDRPLALLLTEFPDLFAGALRHYAPHHLCDYTYRVAQEFSRFYGSCHILSELDDSLRQSRLALCRATVEMLEKALYLLGITLPERM